MTDESTRHHGNTTRSSRWRTLGLAGLGMAITVVAALVNRESAPPAILADIVLVALGGVVLMHVGRGLFLGWTPWIAAGALSGVTLVAVLEVAPWPLAAALAFATAGFLGPRGKRPRLAVRSGIFVLSAAANATLLWTLIFSEHRPVSPAEFNSRDLRLHELLADVPLHDVWVAHLSGGPRGMTLRDVRWLLVDGFRHNLNAAFLTVASVREVLGSLFRWDNDRCESSEASFVHRLTETDKRRSLTEPGDSMFVYTFEHEALIEITNCTVHAFVGIALEPVEDGYDVYWAFYVKRVSWITPFYMALIDPFRHTVIYPPLIEGIEHEWTEQWSSSDTERRPALVTTLGEDARIVLVSLQIDEVASGDTRAYDGAATLMGSLNR